jgi:hypothetical protein
MTQFSNIKVFLRDIDQKQFCVQSLNSIYLAVAFKVLFCFYRVG